MKLETNEKIGRWLVIGICFTAYVFLLCSVLATALDTNLYLSLLG